MINGKYLGKKNHKDVINMMTDAVDAAIATVVKPSASTLKTRPALIWIT